MATVTGLTAEYMLALSDANIVSGSIDEDGDLQLTTRSGSTINAGHTVGAKGDVGDVGPPGPPGVTNFPTGTVIPWAANTSNAPDGWLILNGQAVSRIDYADLYDLLGNVYGAGDGSTTFNLPDARARMLIGVHTSGIFTTIGATGGSATNTLVEANLPPHVHSMTHDHTVSKTNNTTGQAGARLAAGASANDGTVSTSSFTGNTGTGPGTSAAFNTLDPYLVIGGYIIKT